ncbi:hypothetical protein Vadar_001377 [Vaccinium darrowii]|uniref:Uncharacterized protein n=1 Tax=Vaccinium darrowii TaxID=229202 RepID=A0ACB7WWT6_9ERIC|nr:hypothetical protein Vadar_001377 [Vaccinium darrowii]
MASSSSSSSLTIPANLSLLISNLSSLITIKLDSSNYNLWKSQFYNLLHATNLAEYVDETKLSPLEYILDKSNTEKIKNPEYAQWKLYDSHLLSCITATLSQSVHASVLHCTSSFEVWCILKKCFTTLSRSHLHHLKNKLSSVRKTSSIEEYLREIKNIADQLALASSTTDDEDLVLYTLNGLPE